MKTSKKQMKNNKRKPFIIAEIAQGFEGSEKLVELYLETAYGAGADAVKFQIFYADELSLPDYQEYDFARNLEIEMPFWEKQVERAHKLGLEFYSDVYGLDSFGDLEKIGVDGYKIHTTDINNLPFLKQVARTKKKVFLSTGGCQLAEIEESLAVFKDREITLMYGFQLQPTMPKDNNLARISFLKRRFGLPVGFQDHTLGGSELFFPISLAAMALGAEIIEKHLTLSRLAKLEDCISALTPEEFAAWVKAIKQCSDCFGRKAWQLSQKELAYRQKIRRAVCSKKDIKKGKTIKEEDLILKRTDQKEAIFDLSRALGKKAKKEIKKNSLIKKEFLI